MVSEVESMKTIIYIDGKNILGKMPAGRRIKIVPSEAEREKKK